MEFYLIQIFPVYKDQILPVENMPTQSLKVMESRSLSDTDSDSDISTKLMRKKYGKEIV